MNALDDHGIASDGEESLHDVPARSSKLRGIGEDKGDSEARDSDEEVGTLARHGSTTPDSTVASTAAHAARAAGSDRDTRGLSKSFPRRLMNVLSQDDTENAIVWTPDGLSFVIVSPREFVASVLPRFFKQTKFASFTRKLNRWGFKRVTTGPNSGAYYHKFFQRDNPELCAQMCCRKPGDSIRSGNAHQARQKHSLEHSFDMSSLEPAPFPPGVMPQSSNLGSMLLQSLPNPGLPGGGNHYYHQNPFFAHQQAQMSMPGALGQSGFDGMGPESYGGAASLGMPSSHAAMTPQSSLQQSLLQQQQNQQRLNAQLNHVQQQQQQSAAQYPGMMGGMGVPSIPPPQSLPHGPQEMMKDMDNTGGTLGGAAGAGVMGIGVDASGGGSGAHQSSSSLTGGGGNTMTSLLEQQQLLSRLQMQQQHLESLRRQLQMQQQQQQMLGQATTATNTTGMMPSSSSFGTNNTPGGNNNDGDDENHHSSSRDQFNETRSYGV